MAKLPRAAQQELIANTGVIRQPDGGAGLTAIGRTLGAIGADLGAEAERTAIAEATIRGRDAVTRDERGALVVQPLPAPDTAANRAFIAAAETGFKAQFTDDQQRAAADAQTQHRYDPAGFDATWTGRTQGVLSAVPPAFRKQAEDVLSNLGQQTRNGILIRTQERDYQLSASAWDQQVKQAQDDLAALASTGDVSSPAYLKAAQAHEDLLKAGIASRFINDDRAKVLRETMADEGEALAVSREALDAYALAGRGTAGIKAAKEHLDKILDDPVMSGISESRRRQIVSAAESRIRDAEAIRRQEAQDIRDDAADALTKLKLGYPVPPAEIDRMARRSRAAGDIEFATRLDREAVLQADVSAFGKRPLIEQAETIRDLDATLQAGGGTAEDALRVQGYVQAHNAKARALSDDAWTYGTRAHSNIIGDVAPIDWASDGKAIAAALKTRLPQAERISQVEGVTALPLSKDEIGRLSGVIAVANERQKADLGAVLADGLGPRHLPRVLNELIKKDADARLFATASGIALEAPDLARRIHRGADIVKANPKVLPENNLALRDGFDRQLGTALVRRPDMRAAITDAAMALYADASNQAGDFKGEINPDRLNTALAEITGGVVTFRGQPIIAPRRGMDQTGFDEIMAGLQDSDLGASAPVAADGSRVTAQMIRDHGVLQSVGDGRYAVLLKGIDVDDPTDPHKPYLLDLRNVMPAPVPSTRGRILRPGEGPRAPGAPGMLLDIGAERVDRLTDRRLPTTPRGFGESFDIELDAFRATEQFFSEERAHYDAYEDAIERLYRATGKRVPNPMALPKDEPVPAAGLLRTAIPSRQQALDQLTAALTEARGQHPDLPDPAQIDAKIIADAKAAADLAQRVAPVASGAGRFAGMMWGALTDEVNLMTLPLGASARIAGGTAARILKTALIEGSIGAGTEAAVAVGTADFRSLVGVESNPAANIIAGFAGGAILGGSLRALVEGWRAVRGPAATLAERDAALVLERQMMDVEAAPRRLAVERHLDALDEATQAVARGEPAPRGFEVPTRARGIDDPAPFEDWFSGSAAVDSSGAPLRVFHGTNEQFVVFDSQARGKNTGARDAGEAFFFTDDPTVASSYVDANSPYGGSGVIGFINKITRGLYEKANEKVLSVLNQPSALPSGGNVRPAYLSLKNPMEIKPKKAWQDYDEAVFAAAIKTAKRNGHDGVVFRNVLDQADGEGIPADVYAVFDPKQIRSTFDPDGSDFVDVARTTPTGDPALAARTAAVQSARDTARFLDQPEVTEATVQEARRVAAAENIAVAQEDGTTRRALDLLNDAEDQKRAAKEIADACALGRASE